MDRASTATWTQEFAAHAGAHDGWSGDFAPKTARRGAVRLLADRFGRAAANLGEDEKLRLQKAKEQLRVFQRPSSGRTTKLGRRVEKPGSGQQSGPSGQTDGVQHDRGHTNK